MYRLEACMHGLFVQVGVDRQRRTAIETSTDGALAGKLAWCEKRPSFVRHQFVVTETASKLVSRLNFKHFGSSVQTNTEG
jgi:hypothetical protein